MNSILSLYTPPCTFSVKVITGASKTECFDVMADGVIKIRIASIREDGRANKELLRYLAKEFGVSKSEVSILFWEFNERKVIQIQKK